MLHESVRESVNESAFERAPPHATWWRTLLGHVLAAFVWCWMRTLRVRVIDGATARGFDDCRWVLAFFHGTQVPLLAWRRRRPTQVLVSWSRDGELQARVMAWMGLAVVRGSGSRGGARALIAIVRRARRARNDVAFAVDGPRGPRGVAKAGARVCARNVGGVLVPMGSACARATVLGRAWDRLALPWPFSRVVVVLGAPLPSDTDEASLSVAIEGANAIAARALVSGS